MYLYNKGRLSAQAIFTLGRKYHIKSTSPLPLLDANVTN